MSDTSKEYAKALYELSDSSEVKEDILYSLNTLIESMDDEIKTFMCHPEINKDLKKEIISKAYEEGLFRNFVYCLIDNDRFNDLTEISLEYKKLVDNEKNVTDAVVYSRDELSLEYMDKLRNKLENKLKRSVSLRNELDPKITAGIRILYESKEIDLTLDSKFKNFKDELKESL